jgi:hypothetical protein
MFETLLFCCWFPWSVSAVALIASGQTGWGLGVVGLLIATVVAALIEASHGPY